MLQVSFPDAPPFGDGSDSGSAPFEFSWVQPRIQALVEAGLGATNQFEDMIVPAQQFAVLQRLFRVALNGGFTEEFPLEKLTLLSRETAKYDKRYRTLRWNANPASVAALAPDAQRLRSDLNVADDEQVGMRGCAEKP